MDLSRQEYPALLASLHPSQATTVLADRIRLIHKINTDIADWLQERRRVEDAYAQGLRKLAHRPQLDNAAALGIFQIPWQRIVQATEVVAVSHETFAQKIDEDVERPLREYGTKNRELASMPNVQSDLVALAKNLETSQKKVEKAKEKGPKGADRLASAVTAAEEVRQQWESRAPFVFEQLQAADEGRLNHLRDVLTQLQTHESDHVERSRQAAESCLNVLLNVETADEIKTFAAKINGGRPVMSPRQQAASPPPAAPLPPPPRAQDDAESQRSSTSGPVRPPPVPEPRHTPLGGLKRLGTVMNRRKSVVIPSGGPFSEKKYRSPFSFKRADTSREMQIPESPERSDRPGTALTTQESHNEPTRLPSESNDYEGLGRMSPASPVPQPLPAVVNGMTTPEVPVVAAPASVATDERGVDSEGYSERPPIIDEITQAQRDASGLEEVGMNLTIRDQPIPEDENQAKQAMDDMANQLRLRAQQSGMRRNVGTLRGRRDVRNTVFIPNLPAQGNGVPGFVMGQDSPLVAPPAVPPKHATSPSNATDDQTLSDTTSIRSSHTLHSISGPVTHPDLHESGLNASIVETVNAWFSEGAVTKSFVVGELALAYNGVAEAPQQSIRVRLDNFQALEKVAANPHFVHDLKDKVESDEKRGEYDILLSSITRPSPTVAFKYQVHINPSDTSAFCPVIFKPAWNLEEFQASVIIFYSLNPSFASSMSKDSITLTNLVLTVNLDTSPEEDREVAHATSAVMYPNTGASFRRKQSAVIWKLPEFEVSTGSDNKLLVRFTTTNNWPRKGKVEAKFEVRTPDAGSQLGISAPSRADDTIRIGTDPFADAGAGTSQWKGLPTVRKLVGGKYVSS